MFIFVVSSPLVVPVRTMRTGAGNVLLWAVFNFHAALVHAGRAPEQMPQVSPFPSLRSFSSTKRKEKKLRKTRATVCEPRATEIARETDVCFDVKTIGVQVDPERKTSRKK